MNPRIAVDELQRAGGIPSGRGGEAKQRCTSDEQKRPEALSSAEARMPHGRDEAARRAPLFDGVEQRGQAVLRQRGKLSKLLGQVHRCFNLCGNFLETRPSTRPLFRARAAITHRTFEGKHGRQGRQSGRFG